MVFLSWKNKSQDMTFYGLGCSHLFFLEFQQVYHFFWAVKSVIWAHSLLKGRIILIHIIWSKFFFRLLPLRWIWWKWQTGKNKLYWCWLRIIQFRTISGTTSPWLPHSFNNTWVQHNTTIRKVLHPFNRPSACGLFLLYPARALMVGPYADSSELSYTTWDNKVWNPRSFETKCCWIC